MFFILSMEADPKVEYLPEILKEKHSVMPVTLTEKNLDRSLEYLLRPKKGVQLLLSPLKRGPNSLRTPKSVGGERTPAMALRPKDSPRERATDWETERWLACLLLLLSWRCGNRIAACLLRFLTLRWCKPEVRKFCWITRISKLNNFFNFLLVLSCLLLKIQCSSEQLFFFLFFPFLLLSFSLAFFFLSLDLFN